MSDDYQIGYGRPPRQHQFQKGRSGNPSGRPRKSPTFLTDLRDELRGTFTITKTGKKMRKSQALVKSIVAQGIKGNARLAELIIKLMPQLEALAIAEETTERERARRALMEGLQALADAGKKLRRAEELEEKKEQRVQKPTE